MLLLFARSRLGVSNSLASPASITRIRWQSMIVFIRWAIVSMVQSRNTLRMVAWMSSSVAGSVFAVASSRTKILLSLRMALARQISCFWPTLKLDPLSITVESRPPSSSLTACSSWTDRKAFQSWRSSYSCSGSKLTRTVPVKRMLSCGMIEMLPEKYRQWVKIWSNPKAQKLSSNLSGRVVRSICNWFRQLWFHPRIPKA